MELKQAPTADPGVTYRVEAKAIARRLAQLNESKPEQFLEAVETALSRGWNPKLLEKQMRKQIRKSCGRIQRRRSRQHGVMVLVAEAEKAGFCADGGAYVTLCEEHSTICNHETLRDALDWAPTCEWCEDCLAVSK